MSETNDKFYNFQTILSGELLWKIIVKIKMHSSITKMTSTRWITTVGILKPLGRWAWRYQRGNQNPYIEEEQTTQWPKEKVQKVKQRSTKHTHKTKDGVTPTPLKIGGELRWSGRVSSSCFTSDTCRINLVTDPVISHGRGKDREVFTTSGTYPLSFVTQIFHNGQPSRGGIML